MSTINAVSMVLMATALVAVVLLRRSSHPKSALLAAVSGLLGINGLTALASAVAVGLALLAPAPVLAETTTAATQAASNVPVGAALATGLACIGAGIGVGIAGAAAIGSITEKPEVLGRTLIFVGLAEGTAIYGLIISFMILNS